MKVADINRVFEPLKPLLPQFNQLKSLLWMTQPGGLLKGLYIEDSGSDKYSFYVWAFFLPLYVPTQHVSFTFGIRLAGGKCWNSLNDEHILHLQRSVRHEAIPFFNKADTPLQFAKCLAEIVEDVRDPYVVQAKAYSLVRCGDRLAAAPELHELISILQNMSRVPWTRAMLTEVRIFLARVETDLESTKQVLDNWERESVQNLGLLRTS